MMAADMALQQETPESSLEMPATQSPSGPDTLDSVTALARFEFELGKGNDGTKIMMVEWQDENKSRHRAGTWQVSWSGKKTTFAAEDSPSDNTNRLYFLLPAGEIVPPNVIITYEPPPPQQQQAELSSKKDKPSQSTIQTYNIPSRPSSTDGRRPVLQMTVHPLPAIFTPELGATAKASGMKGVLHTIWAKKRLRALAEEIRSESETNPEGIALDMALAERQWIEKNFGLATPQEKQPSSGSLKLDVGAAQNSGIASPPLSPGWQSPTSPGGRRLTEKLRGLSLSTNNKGINTPTHEAHPLSPEASDMAVSSFSSFKSDKQPSVEAIQPTARKMVPISPPSMVTDDQAQSAHASLASIARGETTSRPHKPADHKEGEEEDLFAVAMSPRDPDEPKSPFSIPGEAGGGGAFSRIKGIR